MKGPEITIDDIAYAKIFMHALKHSYDDVCGILIGKYCDGDKGGKKCVINNSVPLFHTHMLSPFLNLAFTLVENHYKDKEERIVGYYHISADDSKNVDIKKIKVCELVSEKLVKNYEDALICLVQMSRMQFEEGNCMFMQEDSGQWGNVDVEISLQNREFLKKNISNKGYLNIHDFDDHLNCINYDFMNPNLFNNDFRCTHCFSTILISVSHDVRNDIANVDNCHVVLHNVDTRKASMDGESARKCNYHMVIMISFWGKTMEGNIRRSDLLGINGSLPLCFAK
ncbi:hypothetical protein POVCU2_0023730 [Plasmodium ovale curtisi]|uniref:MPN domain-containing protein n=1 Tax=Plasmodium ovale curtisi TaxID=864141 RepID=A0A1A8VU04_PLAOA|nr:hypothetical protein POVCU2_0023730 [Plasmodium ovale curtisi]